MPAEPTSTADWKVRLSAAGDAHTRVPDCGAAEAIKAVTESAGVHSSHGTG